MSKDILERLNSRMDEIIQRAEKEGRDLTDAEHEEYNRTFDAWYSLGPKGRSSGLYRDKGLYRDNGLPRHLAVGGSAMAGDLSLSDFNRMGGAFGSNSNDEDSPLVLRDQSVMPLFRKRGLVEDEYRGLSFGGFCRAMVHGPKSDVERRALSEGTDSAGGFTVPSILMANLIDGLRKKATVMNAGAVTVPLSSNENSIAKIASDPTASWRAENALVDNSDPTFSRIQFIPKTLAVMVKASRELLQDSLNAEAALMNSFSKSMALEIDRVALLGSGADDEPTGIGYDSGVTANDLVLGDVLADYDPFVDSIQALEDRNANSEAAVSIMAPRTKADLAKLVDTTGQPLRKPQSIEGLPMRATTQIPVDEEYNTRSDATRIITGDFSQLFVGIRSELRVEILRERYADNLQCGFLAWMRADIALAHAESFQQVTDVLPD